MTSYRRIALVTGIFFVLTFVSSIGALFLYGPILDDSNYILGSGSELRVSLGAFFEIVLVITNIGSAVALYPLAKRHSESVAISYVASRIIESSIITVGIISLLSVMTLRQDLAGATGADAATLVTAGRSLLAIHDWTFLLGPLFCAGFGNGMLLGYMMFKSGLVPRQMALFGVIGGPLAFTAGTLVLLGAFDQTSAPSFLMTLPEILWEASFGIYLVAKGFKQTALSDHDTDAVVPVGTPRTAAAR